MNIFDLDFLVFFGIHSITIVIWFVILFLWVTLNLGKWSEISLYSISILQSQLKELVKILSLRVADALEILVGI